MLGVDQAYKAVGGKKEETRRTYNTVREQTQVTYILFLSVSLGSHRYRSAKFTQISRDNHFCYVAGA